MWLPILLISVAFTSVIADVEDDMDKCVKDADFENLIEILELPDTDELETICPPMLNFLKCAENVLKDHTGFTIEQLQTLLEGTDMGRFPTVFINIRSVFQDMCDEDSQLNKDYRAHSQCYKSISPPGETSMCKEEALAAFRTQKEFEDKVQEEAGDDEYDDNRECMFAAYEIACAGVEIHEKCGRDAFDIFMQIVRRTTLFKYGICTENQLEGVKTKFFENMEMDSAERELYSLAFNLKKRRK